MKDDYILILKNIYNLCNDKNILDILVDRNSKRNASVGGSKSRKRNKVKALSTFEKEKEQE